MRKIFLSLFLSVCMAGTSFGQIASTGNGKVLTYDVFSAKQQLYKKNITFEPNTDQRVLQLKVEKNGDRQYAFMDGQPFSNYDKDLAMTSLRGKKVDTDARYPLLPTRQKVEAGAQWRFSRKGQASACGNWRIAYHAAAKEGPDTTLQIDGENIALKTLLIEYRGEAKSDRCDPYQQERFVLYTPELHELLMDQGIEFTPDGRTSDFGYKWVLKSVTTRQVPQ